MRFLVQLGINSTSDRWKIAKVGRAAPLIVYYWHDKITHLNVKRGRQKEWTMYISHVKRMMKHKLE